MGYSTDFFGQFKLNKKLDDTTFEFLNKLNQTRRMKRRVDAKYGVDGEFYVDGTGFAGQGHDANIVDHNTPPRTQPGLWCQWIPTEDRQGIIWDGGEKFYHYDAWLQYLIDKVLAPRGYKLTGSVEFQGEDRADFGRITVRNGKVQVKQGKRIY